MHLLATLPVELQTPIIDYLTTKKNGQERFNRALINLGQTCRRLRALALPAALDTVVLSDSPASAAACTALVKSGNCKLVRTLVFECELDDGKVAALAHAVARLEPDLNVGGEKIYPPVGITPVLLNSHLPAWTATLGHFFNVCDVVVDCVRRKTPRNWPKKNPPQTLIMCFRLLVQYFLDAVAASPRKLRRFELCGLPGPTCLNQPSDQVKKLLGSVTDLNLCFRVWEAGTHNHTYHSEYLWNLFTSAQTLTLECLAEDFAGHGFEVCGFADVTIACNNLTSLCLVGDVLPQRLQRFVLLFSERIKSLRFHRCFVVSEPDLRTAQSWGSLFLGLAVEDSPALVDLVVDNVGLREVYSNSDEGALMDKLAALEAAGQKVFLYGQHRFMNRVEINAADTLLAVKAGLDAESFTRLTGIVARNRSRQGDRLFTEAI